MISTRNISRKVSARIAGTDILWSCVRPLVKFFRGIAFERKKHEMAPYDFELTQLFKSPIVRNGPFKGMKYPDYKSFGSAIYPKILGSYEAELNTQLNEILNTDFEFIVDVGAAEGYYTVGLAMRTGLQVYAVDIDPGALELMQRIAELNGVSDKVIAMHGIDRDQLSALCKHHRCLIISDCEGYEKELFTSSVMDDLSNAVILIEVHDNVTLGLGKQLKDIFKHSHNITTVHSFDDIVKYNTYDYNELSNLSEKAKLLCLSENRSNIQEWLYLKPKKGI